MPKLKCYTKPRIPKSKGGAGGTYTTCEEGQKKKEPKKKKLKILKPIEKKKVKPLTEKQLLEKHGTFLKEHQKKEKNKPPKKQTELEKFGLTREQANKMDPSELFGKLQLNVKKTILNPKITGVIVGNFEKKEFWKQFDDEHDNSEGGQHLGYVWTRSGYLQNAANKYKDKEINKYKNKLLTLARKAYTAGTKNADGTPKKAGTRKLRMIGAKSYTIKQAIKIAMATGVSMNDIESVYFDYSYEMRRTDF